MESPPLHRKGHLPTHHHRPLLQLHNPPPRNLHHLRSLVPGHRHRVFRMVHLGRLTHCRRRNGRHASDAHTLYRWSAEYNTCLLYYARELVGIRSR